MTPVHPECQPLYDEVQSLQSQIDALTEDLQHAAPGQKPAIAAEIKKLRAQLLKIRPALNQCLASHPLPTPVTSEFTGWANINFKSFVYRTPNPVRMTLTFSGFDYAVVELKLQALVFQDVIHFQKYGFSYTAGLTISQLGKAMGRYNAVSHNLNIPLSLLVTPTDISGFLGGLLTLDASTITLDPPGLTTEDVPSRIHRGMLHGFALLPATGELRFVGVGMASGGYAGGFPIELEELQGKLNPVP